MRLIGTINRLDQAKRFCSFLSSAGIENQCEIKKNKDWGNENYGDFSCSIWVVDEEKISRAFSLFNRFLHDPEDSYFLLPLEQTLDDSVQKNNHFQKKSASIALSQNPPIGPVTACVLGICVLLFIWGKLTQPFPLPFPAYLPSTSVLSPEINKLLLYDYPNKYTLADQLIQNYGIEDLKKPDLLPTQGKYELVYFLKTPVWDGIYEKIVSTLQTNTNLLKRKSPWFEKLQEGQVWRALSPSLLHSDIFHLLFNMAWLLILGRQIENKYGTWRFVVLITVTALFSNTCQYFVSGPNFIGFSGVLCGMFVFIWCRQKYFPHEGYFLHTSTIRFMVAFVLIMAGIQMIAFFGQVLFDQSISLGIANTAHLPGAFVGFIFARWNLLKGSFTP